MASLRRPRSSQLSVALVAAVTAVASYVSPGLAQAAPPADAPVPTEHVVLPDQASPPATPGGAGLVDNPGRGLVFADLDQAAGDSQCAGMLQARGNGPTTCTHGPDPAPTDIDVRTPRGTAELIGTTAAATTGVPCYGDGTSGTRIQAIYVRAADKADRYDSLLGMMGQWAATTDKTFDDSAAETGGTRHLRWATDAACNLVVERAQVSITGDDSFSATAQELQALGFNRTDRKYLVWVDANVYCGIAGLYGDDRATADNANNGGPSFARVDNGCWGSANSIEAHELMHNLGGVQLSAPHTSGGYHCTDDSDLMCYVDAAGVTMSSTCDSTHERLFDCNHDDYFHTAPSAGTYLATYWNSANNVFLEKSNPGTTTTTTVPPVTTTTTAPPPTTTTTAPPPTTTTTIAPPPPSTTSVTYSGALNRKTTSRSFAVTTGSGTLDASVDFTKSSSLSLKVLNSAGQVVAQMTGASPVRLSVPVAAGSYSVVVSSTTNASFVLNITHPSP